MVKTTRKKKVVTEEPVPQEHIIVQLPIQPAQPQEPQQEDPLPYVPDNNFVSHNDKIESGTIHTSHSDKKNCCYWCCHSIGPKEFGMPIKYDTTHRSFTTYGNFCSLECVVAYNYDHYMGSDRMWEIHSWIQWMAHRMGYDTPIRPAPNKYLLKMFNGPLTIEEFREAHKNYYKTYVMNMPPLIHVQGQMEGINTSYLNQKIHITTVNEESNDKIKLTRKKAVMDMNKTLDSKMNLTIKNVGV
jgi:hypothetical protein